MTEERNKRKVRIGIVVSDKMDKTVVVKLERTTTHPKYKKIIKQTIRVQAHDEENKSKTGDHVTIMETRPLSKLKKWRVINN
ncbi:MAG: 30S ribosomal protein S17 [Candidatus Margulisbacteria bacterium GWF2_35_9]|nr:ribosomal protein S17 [uncultured bacterium]OGI07008.1 MAG: 30S ribosomal protein S17 [Candidatus Margulisbacteria bacterium GWF2_35_9]